MLMHVVCCCAPCCAPCQGNLEALSGGDDRNYAEFERRQEQNKAKHAKFNKFRRRG